MGSPQLGRNLLIQLNITGGWNTVGGLKATGVLLGSVVVDTTSVRSGGWREILNDCGNQTVTITGSGVFKNTTADFYIRSAFFNPNLQPLRAIQDDGHYFNGNFKVSKIQYQGAYNDALLYDYTLESSGVITFT